MTRYVSNPNSPHNFITWEEYEKVRPVTAGRGPTIIPDLPDTVSPIDGSTIHGRAGFRKHFKEHNVTWADDFKEEWKKPRVDPARTPAARRERIEAIKQAIEKQGSRR